MPARIEIRSTDAKIGIETSPPQLKIHTNHNLLRMKRIPAQLIIKSTHAKVNIDQSECFYESGLKSPVRFAKDIYRTALKKGIQAIGKIASESKRFLAINQPGIPAADIARSDMVNIRQFGLKAIPRSRPKVTVEPARVEVTYKPGDIQMEWNTERPKVEYVAGEVHIYLRQQPKVEVAVIYDKATGRSYTKQITPDERRKFDELL